MSARVLPASKIFKDELQEKQLPTFPYELRKSKESLEAMNHQPAA